MSLAILLAILLLLSALMSGSETALFTLARDKRKLEEERLRAGDNSSILNLLRHPNRLLMTVLLGNLLVNLSFFAFSSMFIMQVSASMSTGMSFLVSLFFLLLVILFGEILPKLYATMAPYRVSRLGAPVVYRLAQVLMPLTAALEVSVHAVNRLVGLESKGRMHIDQEHLRQLVDISEQKGSLQDGNADIMGKLIDFSTIQLKEVCIPRVDVKSCRIDDTVEQIEARAREWKLFILPLHDQHHDDVGHYINIIETEECGNKKGAPARVYARPIPCLSELSKMDFVLREFLENEWTIALVVDEYGDMSGIVTWNGMMDCLRSTFSDQSYHHGSLRNGKIVLGRQNMRDLGLLEELRENDSVTVGGFLATLMDRMPRVGDEIIYKSVRFVVLKADEKGIDEAIMLPLGRVGKGA